MNERREAALYVVGGVLLVALALTFPPLGERVFVAEVVGQGPPPADEQVTAYAELSQPAQDAVDEILREEWTTLSNYDDYAALEALPRTFYVEKGGEVYHVSMTGADDGGCSRGSSATRSWQVADSCSRRRFTRSIAGDGLRRCSSFRSPRRPSSSA